ncbi:hypothetical protein D3C81_410610 [compost metagenome]
MQKPESITTRVDLVAQPPFKKQPPSFPRINYDQVLYTLHVQFEWQGHSVRFIGYLSPGTLLTDHHKLDPAINLILTRLVVHDRDGKYIEGFEEEAPLMKAWHGDKLISVGQMCEELGIRDEHIHLYQLRGNLNGWGMSKDYEDTPEHNGLVELHEQVIPLMFKCGIGAVKLRFEDGQVRVLDMYPLGLCQGDTEGFYRAMKELVGDRDLIIRAHSAGGSTFTLNEGKGQIKQTFASFVM